VVSMITENRCADLSQLPLFLAVERSPRSVFLPVETPGAVFLTLPWKIFPGNASKAISTLSPGLTRPSALSSLNCWVQRVVKWLGARHVSPAMAGPCPEA